MNIRPLRKAGTSCGALVEPQSGDCNDRSNAPDFDDIDAHAANVEAKNEFRYLRSQLDWSYRYCGEFLGINHTSVYDVENDSRKHPRHSWILRMRAELARRAGRKSA